MQNLNVTLIGATGLIGSQLLNLLTLEPRIAEIHVITRKKITFSHAKIKNTVVDFSTLINLPCSFEQGVFISCLGTTLAQAGSKEKFKLVDFEFNVNFAKLAKKCNAKKFLLVSSLGANIHSPVFYNKIKGQTEEEIKKLSLTQIEIFRPSLLIGKRLDNRPGEFLAQKIMPLINPLLQGPLKKYQTIEASAVAQKMLNATLDFKPGIFVYESDEIKDKLTF